MSDSPSLGPSSSSLVPHSTRGLDVGSRLGPFRLLTRLGEGGFAPVYLAAEEYGGIEVRVVALKVFFTDRLGHKAFEQVIAEARALSRVEHRNVVRYFQILIDQPSSSVALAMEHVRGDSLGRKLETTRALGLGETLEVGAAVASALAAVHAAGLVHRDIKPDNVIDANGVFKVIDFGIAVSQDAVPRRASTPMSLPPAHAEDRTLVMVGAPTRSAEPEGTMTHDENDSTRPLVAGTMGYIDPECMKGASPDPSSDLYALGCMLYECLGGHVPAYPPPAAVIQQAIAFGLEPPPSIRQVVPSVPEPVARLIDSLVDPDRARRPRHAEAVLAELERLRRGVVRPKSLPEEGPFRGLDAFDERHRDVFFGRSTDLAAALESLRSRGVLALIGPSGSGKSSFARAALLPAVAEGELGGWPKRYEPILARPGLFPRRALGGADLGPDAFVAQLASRVEANECGVVIYLDALEELITLSEPSERAWLADVVARLARAPVPGVRLVVSARRDFLDQLLGIPALGPTLARSVQLVAPLGGRAFADSVEDRLAAYGYRVEDPGMLDELVGAPEAMPLFEFALARLWAERDETHRVLSRAALARVGGVAGALERHAEHTLHGLIRQTGPAGEAMARSVLLSLTTPSGTRRRRTVEEIVADARTPLATSVIAAFERARLVVAEEGKVTLAHEALLERWPRLHQWMLSVRKEREIAEETEAAASRWREKREDRSLLARGRVLGESLSVMPRLSPNAQAFLRASQRAERRGITGVVVLVGTVFIGIAVLFGLYLLLEKDAHEKEKAAEDLAGTLTRTGMTPEAEKAKAINQLIEDKTACEHKLAACIDGGAQP